MGNSGTGARLLAGFLSGLGINATITGDKSLSSRPMKRIVEPLTKMGFELNSNNHRLPIEIIQSNGSSFLNTIHQFQALKLNHPSYWLHLLAQ
ncbi:MAG: hypothetical protein CM15mP104_3210 [Gammaproteobacteria bacterium]|nr:MAG: hypothetical protein CM15mP104_3210 [Gammaproteobacteria bacterium]